MALTASNAPPVEPWPDDAPALVSWIRRAALTGEAKRIRVERGWTGKEIAKWIGVDRAQVFHWEAGRHVPNADHALAWARILRSELR